MQIRKSVSYSLAILLLSCKPSGPAISQISGNYSGSLITHTTADFEKISVSSNIPASQGRSKVISVGSPSGVALSLEFTDLTNSGLTLTSSVGLSGPMALTFDAQSGCYSGEGVELCTSNPEITFEVSDTKGGSILSLVLYASEANGTQVEKPQVFSLTQAIARAQNMSFQSKIEFQHVIQARETATAAYLHLVPQLTLPTLANNLAPGFSSLLGAIADLAPFLLPSRWIEAKEATKQSQVEQDSERLMRLDMASQVEGLFYTYDRDRRSQAVYKTFETRVTVILDAVTKSESAGHLISGSADTVQAAYNDLTHNDGVYEQVLTEDRSALSQSLGFFNPLAVQDAQIDVEPVTVDSAPAADFNTVNQAALARSIEVDQLGDLIAEAKLAKKEEFFDWLDPMGNPQLGLGLALPAQLTIAQSQVNELAITRDQTQSGISQEALNAVTDYEQALDNYQDAQSDTVLHEHRLSTILQQLNSGDSVDAFDLCSIIADDLGANLALEQARADYRVSRAEIDRLQLQGFYQSF
jgi:hypothetical protein